MRRGLELTVFALALAACASEVPRNAEHGDDAAPHAPSAAPSSTGSGSAVAPAATGALTQASRKLVCERLTSELMVELHVSPGIVTEAFLAQVKSLLESYQRAEVGGAASKLRFRVVEVATTDAATLAAREGLAEGPVSSDPAKPLDMRSRYFGFVLRYGAQKAVIPFWPPSEKPVGMEFFLTTKMRELWGRDAGVSSHVGVIVGKDGFELDESYTTSAQNVSFASVVEQYFPYYEIEDVDLHGGDQEIDPALRGVIVLQPSKAFTKRELARLDDFLMRGDRSLVFFVSAVGLQRSDKSMSAKLDRWGLDPILSGYGVELGNALVLDRELAFRQPIVAASGKDATLLYPPLPVLKGDRLDSGFAPFRGIPALPFPFSSPLTLHADRQPDARLKVVARSAASATLGASRTQSLAIDEDFTSAGPAGERPIAVAVEGKIRSAFGATAGGRSAKNGRVLIVASSQFLANPFARSGNPPPLPPQLQMMGPQPGDPLLMALAQRFASDHFSPTMVSFKNTLDWMTFDDDFAELGAQLLAARAAK